MNGPIFDPSTTYLASSRKGLNISFHEAKSDVVMLESGYRK